VVEMKFNTTGKGLSTASSKVRLLHEAELIAITAPSN
jgi:hypothetical protein